MSVVYVIHVLFVHSVCNICNGCNVPNLCNTCNICNICNLYGCVICGNVCMSFDWIVALYVCSSVQPGRMHVCAYEGRHAGMCGCF